MSNTPDLVLVLKRDFEFKTAAEKKTAEEMNKVDVSQKLDQVYKRSSLMQILRNHGQLPFLRSVLSIFHAFC